MKNFYVLFLGVLLGIAGEFFIPEQFQVALDYGCYKPRNHPVVFMPNLNLYEIDTQQIYPYYGKETIPSYEVMWDILSGRLIKLSQNDCNDLKMKVSNVK